MNENDVANLLLQGVPVEVGERVIAIKSTFSYLTGFTGVVTSIRESGEVFVIKFDCKHHRWLKDHLRLTAAACTADNFIRAFQD